MLKKIAVTAMMLAMALPAFAQTTAEVNAEATVGAGGPANAMCFPMKSKVTGEIRCFRSANDKQDGSWEPVRPASAEAKVKMNAGVRAEVKEIRQGVRAEIKNDRQETREDNKENRQQMMEDRKAAMEANQAAMKKFQEERMQAVKDMQARAAAAREKAKIEVKGIKDAARQQAALTINENLSTVNKKMTDQFTQNLTKIGEVLTQISTKADALSTAGTDVTAAQAAIVTANASLAAARAAVTVQTSMTYTFTAPTTDSTVKADLMAVRQKLEADLKAVQVLVAKARDDVRLAGQAVAKVSVGANATVN